LKKIKTFSTIKYSENIKPAKSFIPEWYKDSSRYVGNNDKLQVSLDGNSNPGIKLCSPFLDSLTTGYIATLWQDIYVEKTELGSSIRWRPSQHEKHIESSDSPVNERPRRNGPAEHLPTPAGHQEQHFAWLHPYTFELPEGYSAIVTHPLNRFDLPFTTLSGVVDADLFPMVPGNIPFFIKNNFSGLIKQGTPIFQIIPFKRESWKSEIDPGLIEKIKQVRFKSTSVFSGWYKKNSWSKKHYE
jgi:hypothetical protein